MTRAILRFTESDPRVRCWNDAPVRAGAQYVLYWCQAYRRARDNAALAYAIERANELGLPCVFYESIRPDYPHASDRFHTFALECARDNARDCAARGVAYAFFLPRTRDEARGVVGKLAARAALVVSDEHPGFLFPAQNAAAAKGAGCAFVTIDDAAGVPMALFPKEETAARTLRPKLLKLRDAWALRPLHEPEPRVAPPARLPLPFDPVDLARADLGDLVARCAIDHTVPAVIESPGGAREADARLDRFVNKRLTAYAIDRNDPSRDGTTNLSPYLHWGAISARGVAIAVRDAAIDRNATESGDALLEQLLVRRGLAFNFAARSASATSYESLPAWARATLAAHARDKRPALVSPEDLEAARSPDALWNAAQSELVTRGTIQGYARMLWGKLVLTWTERPADAHALLVRLNDRYALDGRDPDGWANIGWCFGLHDRPWPERPIFGNVRAMTSRSARSKLPFEDYIARYGTGASAYDST
ncbi:MAG: deoxyribodipyrimidine photo-lyase [Polyangiaceae bacterium]